MKFYTRQCSVSNVFALFL